jgi:hypothetical protein
MHFNLDTWDRNGSTSGPTPWQIDDDDDMHFNFDVMVAPVESSLSHWGCWLNSPTPDFFLGGNFFQIVAGGTKYPDQVFCDSASICQCNTLKLTMAAFSFICISFCMIMPSVLRSTGSLICYSYIIYKTFIIFYRSKMKHILKALKW